MTLQNLLLKLSYNKRIRVDIFISDGRCDITIEDWYNSTELLKVSDIDLSKPIDADKFNKYIK